MKITLLTVGRTDVDWVKTGLELYRSRLLHYVLFTVVEIPELKNASSLSRDQIKSREGELILRKLKDSDEVILLDEKGKEYRSVEFAQMLLSRISTSSRDLVFVVGGAYGFSKEVYDRSSGMLSLSRMTFSHQMAATAANRNIFFIAQSSFSQINLLHHRNSGLADHWRQ